MCTLRITGPEDKLKSTLSKLDLKAKEAVAMEVARKKGKVITETTYNVQVSDSDGDHIPIQLEDAKIFLDDHKDTFSKLNEFECTLDFQWDIPVDSNGQYNRIDLDLIAKCNELGIEIEFSVYLKS